MNEDRCVNVEICKTSIVKDSSVSHCFFLQCILLTSTIVIQTFVHDLERYCIFFTQWNRNLVNYTNSGNLKTH